MKPSIITISRQFGSGGREIGAELAQRLHLPFFEKTGIFLTYFHRHRTLSICL